MGNILLLCKYNGQLTNFRRFIMSEQNSKIAEMLDHLVNDDTAKAEELFHEYVVEKSRDIYEGLIEDEVEEATSEDDEAVEEASEDEDEAVDEASDNDDEDAVEESADADDEEVEEGFDEVEMEADDEDEDESDPDATGDMMGDLEEPEGEEGEGDGEAADKGDIMDLTTAIRDLEDAFKEYADGEKDEMDEPEMDDMEAIQPEFESEEGAEDLETVREYANDVKDGHGAEKKGKPESADNKASPVAKPNNMGGTTANIAKGGEGGGSETGLTGKPKDMNTKNINKVGGSSDNERMSNNGSGHGAEKKGAGEGSADATSIIGSK